MMRLGRFLILLVLLAAAGQAWAGPKVERVTTASGIEAWLVREPSIPMLAFQAVWRGGRNLDPQGKEGRQSLALALLTEGAGDLDSEAFQGELRRRSISMGFGADRDYTSLDIRVLNQQRDRAFELLRLALTHPRFDAEPVQRLKAQALVAAQRAKSNPSSIANERLFKEAFPDHVYGRPSQPAPESLAALTVEDFKEGIAAAFSSRDIVIGAVGDIEPGELARLIDTAFSGLPERPLPPLPPRVVPRMAAKPILLPYNNPQSNVLFALPGLLRDDPDYYAASVLAYVVGGGGLTSQLAEEIREKRGLVYTVGLQLVPMPSAGLIYGSLGTRNEQAAEALKLVRQVLRRVGREGITAEEIKSAKAYLTGSFPLRLTSNAAIAGMLTAIQLSKLGPDYMDRYAGYIEAVTPEDIKRVAAKLFGGEGDMLVIAIGQPGELE